MVLKPGRDLGGEELRGRLKAQLSAFKIPKLIAFFEPGALPYRANGKIDKPGLEALLAERAGAEGA